MASNQNPDLEWHYCIEIVSDFKGLAVLKEDIEEWMERNHWPEHREEIAQPAKVIIRFQDYNRAQHFYFSFRDAKATFTYLNDKVKPTNGP